MSAESAYLATHVPTPTSAVPAKDDTIALESTDGIGARCNDCVVSPPVSLPSLPYPQLYPAPRIQTNIPVPLPRKARASPNPHLHPQRHHLPPLQHPPAPPSQGMTSAAHLLTSPRWSLNPHPFRPHLPVLQQSPAPSCQGSTSAPPSLTKSLDPAQTPTAGKPTMDRCTACGLTLTRSLPSALMPLSRLGP